MGRAERRAIERQNRKSETLAKRYREIYQAKVDKILDNSADSFQKQLEQYHNDYLEAAIENWGWFYALAAITLKREYHKTDEWIYKFIERTEEFRKDCFEKKLDQSEVLKMCEEETGVCLQSE